MYDRSRRRAAPQPGPRQQGKPRHRGITAISCRIEKGPVPPMSIVQTFEMACSQSWGAGCSNAGMSYLHGQGVAANHTRTLGSFQMACDLKEPTGCANLGLMYQREDGVPSDAARAVALFDRACTLGLAVACAWRNQVQFR